MDLNHKILTLIIKKSLFNIFGTLLCKKMERKFKCMHLNHVLPSLMTLQIAIFKFKKLILALSSARLRLGMVSTALAIK